MMTQQFITNEDILSQFTTLVQFNRAHLSRVGHAVIRQQNDVHATLEVAVADPLPQQPEGAVSVHQHGVRLGR